ncbi:MAG: helix-hairpin-helix domain-containing protein [Planctomycetia bacterium]|nr:helix-hairpin-helix domain-containing protein [Planctomycetia bacterium]
MLRYIISVIVMKRIQSENLQLLMIFFAIFFCIAYFFNDKWKSVQDIFPLITHSSVPCPLLNDSSTNSNLKSFSLKTSSLSQPSFNEVSPNYAFHIDINTADWTALILLPGIGETLAKRVIEYRCNVARFQSPGDICQIKGIGNKKFEKIAPFIYCSKIDPLEDN